MMEQQEQETSQQLSSTRSRMGSITAAREQSQAALKQITLLENRLDKSFIRFNEAVTHNKQLRAQIDGLRRERLMFEALDATLQKELLKTKADMAELIQAANVMHMSKEVALTEVCSAASTCTCTWTICRHVGSPACCSTAVPCWTSVMRSTGLPWHAACTSGSARVNGVLGSLGYSAAVPAALCRRWLS